MRRLLSVLIPLFLLGCSQNNSKSLLLSDDIIQNVNLEDIASDVQVLSVKSPYLMEGIEMCQGIGDLLFCISENHRVIYWIKEDSVIAKLDKYGRGHGEYLWIESCAYAPDDSILFIRTTDNRLIRYRGLNCKYIGECSVFPAAARLYALNGRTLLAQISVPGDDNIHHQGLYLIDAETGEIGRNVCPMDYAQHSFYNGNKYQTADSIMFIIPGPGNDDNVLYLLKDEQLSPLLTFRYEDKWRIPESVLIRELHTDYASDVNKVHQMLALGQYRIKEPFCNGGAYLFYSDGRLMFWSLSDYFVLNIIKNNDVNRYRVSLPGFDKYLNPNAVVADYYVTVFNSIFKSQIENEDELSPLGRQIKKVIDSSDGNPVLLKYHIK